VSFEIAVQSAVYTALTGHAPLVALVTGIRDAVEQDTAYPYVTIGEDAHVEDDTDDRGARDCTITIHVWSRYRGRKDTKQIQGEIYNALHRANLSHSGYVFTDSHFLSSDSFMDSDGRTRHGVQTFRILIRSI